MTALRRMSLKLLSGGAAAISLAFAFPAAAQSNDAPIDVTAAPPPSPETVGPSQLRDFNLQGTVTRPADQPAATSSQPVSTAPAQARQGDAVPSEAARTAGPVAVNRTRTASATQISDVPSSGSIASRGSETVTPSIPSEVTTNPAPQPAGIAPANQSLSPGRSSWSWPWIAALIALLAGGGFFAWRRRGLSRRRADPGRVAFAGLVRDAALDERHLPEPKAGPKPDPVPARGRPAPVPQSSAVPQAGPAIAPTPVREDDGLIVSTRLKPELNVQLLPDRVVVTDQEVMLQFDVVLTNTGSAPARDLLVEARLVTAHAGQDQEIADFFQMPPGNGDRMAGIAPLGKISLKSVVRLPLEMVQSFEAEGRRLFVPLVAFNIVFRSSGGEGRASASFLIGRGSEEDERLAPFRLDLGPRVFRGLVARAHSIGLLPA